MNLNDPAQISTGDALVLRELVREWRAGKLGGSPGGTPLPDASLAGPIGWIIPSTATLLTGKYFRWKYGATVVSTPFAKLLGSPMTDLSTATTFAFNTAENANTQTQVLGDIAVVTASPECGDCIGLSPITDTYKGPVLAQLFWTFFESGDPATGYWAWWFTLPNRVVYKES